MLDFSDRLDKCGAPPFKLALRCAVLAVADDVKPIVWLALALALALDFSAVCVGHSSKALIKEIGGFAAGG